MLARHPIAGFFVLAYAFSWIAWSPWWLGQDGLGLLPIPGALEVVAVVNPLGIFGPAAAALVVIRATEGSAGVRRFWADVTSVRLGLRWWGVGLLGIPAILLAGAVLLPGTMSSFSSQGLAGVLMIYPLQLLGIIFLGGGLEEVGWRGFAQPRLQQQHPPLVAAVAVGIIWAGWHAPLFLTRTWDTPRSNAAEILLYVVVVIGLSVVLAWIRNASGSTLAAVVAHASVNGFLGVLVVMFPGSLVETANWWGLGVLVAAVVVAIVTKGRLGATDQQLDSSATTVAGAASR